MNCPKSSITNEKPAKLNFRMSRDQTKAASRQTRFRLLVVDVVGAVVVVVDDDAVVVVDVVVV